jgi:hypothetical protein
LGAQPAPTPCRVRSPASGERPLARSSQRRRGATTRGRRSARGSGRMAKAGS